LYSGFKAEPLWLETSDGVRLYAIEAGRGPTTVVLAHQGLSNLCDTIDYAKTLLASGLRIVAFDFRGNGLSQRPTQNALALGRDLAAAVARAHDNGAEHVFLIGASMGGAAAVQNSAGLPVAGIVSLSGTRLWSGFGINKPGARALRAPLLYIGSRDDSPPLGRSPHGCPHSRLAGQAQCPLPRSASRLGARSGPAGGPQDTRLDPRLDPSPLVSPDRDGEASGPAKPENERPAFAGLSQ